MTVWSSPFPCRVPDSWDPPLPFPGPPGTVLLFDSPDRVLMAWGRQGECDGAELERFEHGCQALLNLRDQGSHGVQPCWANGVAPDADGITACLLLPLLQASPDVLSCYLKLDPDYLHRLLQAQTRPRQLLNQWLQRPTRVVEPDQPLERQLQAAVKELDQRIAEQRQIEALLEQHKDQQRRTRRLLAGWTQLQADG